MSMYWCYSVRYFKAVQCLGVSSLASLLFDTLSRNRKRLQKELPRSRHTCFFTSWETCQTNTSTSMPRSSAASKMSSSLRMTRKSKTISRNWVRVAEALNMAEALPRRLHHRGEAPLANSSEWDSMANVDSRTCNNEIEVYVRFGRTQCPPLLGVLHLVFCVYFLCVAMLNCVLTIVTYGTGDKTVLHLTSHFFAL